MGWTLNIRKQTVRMACHFVALAMLTFASIQSRAAYVPPPGQPGYNNKNTDGTFTDDTFLTMANSFIQLSVGLGKNQGGAIGVFTTNSNGTDPADTLLYYEPLIPKDTPNYVASRVFVRVDGGINGGNRGMDYEWGQPDTTKAGQWLQYPTVVGGHMIARWQTYAIKPLTGTGTGTGGNTGGGTSNTTNIDPQIEVDLLASFIHNQVRFQFNIINNDTGHAHTVGLVFEQAHAESALRLPDVNNATHLLASTSAPIRIPNQPYLRSETLLTGTQIPAYWEIQQPYAPTFLNAVGTAHTVRGTLRPTATSGTEPTVPSRFALGQSVKLDGQVAPPVTNPLPGQTTGNVSVPGPTGRYFDTIWNFTPTASVRFDNVGSPYGSIALYYDEQPVSPGQIVPIVAYIGQSDSDIDVGTPLGLTVSAPIALDYNATTGNVPFTVNAYVSNLLDLQPGGGVALAPVGVSLDLPAGLVFHNDVSSKTIASIAPGGEGSVAWSVVADGTKTGQLTYTVTAAAGIGPGKTVQRSVYVPNVPAVDLVGNTVSKGLYQMISLPLDTRGDLITAVLYPGQNTNLITPDVVTWNPATGLYDTATTFQLGKSYWIRTRSSSSEHITFNVGATGYKPLANQLQPGAAAYTVTYSQGWNQIGNPYVYPINFSEIQIFDPATMAINTVADASLPVNQLVLPAVYSYDTSDPSAANWHNVLQPSIGFQMKPYTGYWVYLRRPNLQFIYPGVDTPGVTVTRAAKVGAGLSRRIANANTPLVAAQGSSNNWQLKISAKSDNGYDPDNYIGVAPSATDNLDNYKYSKPPVINRTVSLDIVNPTWDKNARYGLDLRSPTLSTKTWNMTVTSAKPNDTVTLSWPGITNAVPRNYDLTLVDTNTNTRTVMRNKASYTVTTGNDGTANVQIVAEPKTAQPSLAINTFEIVNNTAPSRGTVSANINFTLYGDADAQVLVRNTRGQVIRTLNPTTKAVGAGVSSGSAFWDLKSQQGSTVATGQYNLELRLKATNGRSVRRTASFLVTR